MKYLSDYLNIIPLQVSQGTAVGTSAKVRFDKGGGGDFSILCQAGFHTTVDLGGCTGGDYSATDAGNAIDFTVVEATAASAAGSAITGATLTLGPSTVCVSRGGAISAIEVTSNLTTDVSVNINGYDYHTSTTGPGRDGENIATELAAVINGRGTNRPLAHYEALPNIYSTGLVLLSPTDDQGTGITIITTAAGSTYRPLPGLTQGCINIQCSKLSSNTPKYIGVICGESTAIVSRAVSLVRFPTAGGAFPGAVVNVTT